MSRLFVSIIQGMLVVCVYTEISASSRMDSLLLIGSSPATSDSGSEKNVKWPFVDSKWLIFEGVLNYDAMLADGRIINRRFDTPFRLATNESDLFFWSSLSTTQHVEGRAFESSDTRWIYANTHLSHFIISRKVTGVAASEWVIAQFGALDIKSCDQVYGLSLFLGSSRFINEVVDSPEVSPDQSVESAKVLAVGANSWEVEATASSGSSKIRFNEQWNASVPQVVHAKLSLPTLFVNVLRDYPDDRFRGTQTFTMTGEWRVSEAKPVWADPLPEGAPIEVFRRRDVKTLEPVSGVKYEWRSGDIVPITGANRSQLIDDRTSSFVGQTAAQSSRRLVVIMLFSMTMIVLLFVGMLAVRHRSRKVGAL
jgi:hypothetical protein